MVEPNPYEPPSHDGTSKEVRNPKASSAYPISRGIAGYCVLLFLFWLGVAPFIAPTDVAPESAPPTPAYLVTIQVVVCYGVPGLLIYLDYRGYRGEVDKD